MTDQNEDQLTDDEVVLVHFVSSLGAIYEVKYGKDIDSAIQFINDHFGNPLDEAVHAQELISEVTTLEITPKRAFINGFFAGAIAYRDMCDTYCVKINTMEDTVRNLSNLSSFDLLKKLFGINESEEE